MAKTKSSKSRKRSKRRKLSKLLKKIPNIKARIPTCRGSIVLKSKKTYSRSKNKEIARSLSD